MIVSSLAIERGQPHALLGNMYGTSTQPGNLATLSIMQMVTSTSYESWYIPSLIPSPPQLSLVPVLVTETLVLTIGVVATDD